MSAKTQVLVVDDEAAILRFLKPALEANGYELTSAASVAEATKHIAAHSPDIVLLDLGLPDGDGKDVIKRAREWSDVPIIVLSAREREAEKIEAFDLGADDYVNKPFNVGELLARMRTALRHRMQRKAEIPVLRVGDLEVDAVRHRATRAGAELKLTPKEFELLSFLAKHAGRVVTHKQILAAVWGPAHTEDTQYLRVYIGQLRQKVEEHADDPRIILTEPGIGYRSHRKLTSRPAFGLGAAFRNGSRLDLDGRLAVSVRNISWASPLNGIQDAVFNAGLNANGLEAVFPATDKSSLRRRQ